MRYNDDRDVSIGLLLGTLGVYARVQLRRAQVRALSDNDLFEFHESFHASEQLLEELRRLRMCDGDDRDVLIDFTAGSVTLVPRG